MQKYSDVQWNILQLKVKCVLFGDCEEEPPAPSWPHTNPSPELASELHWPADATELGAKALLY